MGGSSSSAPLDVPAGRVAMSATHMTDRAGDAFSFAEGHTGAGVNAVSLVLDDGAKVQATVGGGWFVAWWPGLRSVKAAEVTAPAGTQTQTFRPEPAERAVRREPLLRSRRAGRGCEQFVREQRRPELRHQRPELQLTLAANARSRSANSSSKWRSVASWS